MYYLGFLKHNMRDVVIFRAIVKPQKDSYKYFLHVMGPYPSENQARRVLSAMRTEYPFRENPSKESRAKYCRERQLDPHGFAKGSFRTIRLGAKKKGVIACAKGKYRSGRCGVGMKLQTILHPVGTRGCPVGGLELKKRTKNPISHAQALKLTKKIVAFGKKLLAHEVAGVRKGNPATPHLRKFLSHMNTLEKYVVGSKPYIEALAKAYEHLQAVKKK